MKRQGRDRAAPTKSEHAATPRRGVQRTTWKQRAVLLGVSLVLLAFLEGVLRLLSVAPPYRPRDPLLEGGRGETAYTLVRDADGTETYRALWKNPDYEFNFQPIPAVKAPDEVRIFVFGGSSAVGYPYDGRLAFSSFLEAGLNAVVAGKRVRVFNVAQNAIPAGTCRRLMTEMARYQPDVFVVYSGNNEYSNEHVYRHIRRGMGAVRSVQAAARRSALYRALERLILPARARIYAEFVVSEEGVQVVPYSPAERQILMDNYAYAVQSMADFCRGQGIRLVVSTVAANAADWPPYRSTFHPDTPAESRAAWLAGFAEALDAVAAGRPERALEILEALLGVDDARADAHFLRGKALRALGRLTEARECFERALDLDNVRYRAGPEHNAILRRVAAATGTPLADSLQALHNAAEDGLLGLDLFWDHCHPTPDAHRILAREIAAAIFRSGALRPSREPWQTSFDQAVERWRGSLELSPRLVARAYRDAAQGWLGLWTSHRAHDQPLRLQEEFLAGALQRLDRAIALDPTLPGAHFYRGVIYAQLGETQQAQAEWAQERALGSSDGPMRQVLEGLLNGVIRSDRGFESWLFIRNEMIR